MIEFLNKLKNLFVKSKSDSMEWTLYGLDSKGHFFLYNKESVHHVTNEIVNVMTKRYFSDEQRNELIQRYKNMGHPIEGYDELSHEVGLVMINTRERKLQLLSVTHYDKKDRVLYFGQSHTDDWTDIVPGSIYDDLRETVSK